VVCGVGLCPQCEGGKDTGCVDEGAGCGNQGGGGGVVARPVWGGGELDLVSMRA